MQTFIFGRFDELLMHFSFRPFLGRSRSHFASSHRSSPFSHFVTFSRSNQQWLIAHSSLSVDRLDSTARLETRPHFGSALAFETAHVLFMLFWFGKRHFGRMHFLDQRRVILSRSTSTILVGNRKLHFVSAPLWLACRQRPVLGLGKRSSVLSLLFFDASFDALLLPITCSHSAHPYNAL